MRVSGYEGPMTKDHTSFELSMMHQHSLFSCSAVLLCAGVHATPMAVETLASVHKGACEVQKKKKLVE